MAKEITVWEDIYGKIHKTKQECELAEISEIAKEKLSELIAKDLYCYDLDGVVDFIVNHWYEISEIMK